MGFRIVDCPTQLICTWIFICWVGGGDSIQGVVKCLSPYFRQEWAFLTNFFCRIYMSTDWRRVRNQKLIHKWKTYQKTKFSKKFLKRAHLKSGISEMCHHKSRNPELAHFRNSQFLVAHIRNSWIELAHFEISWFVVKHFRNSWFEALENFVFWYVFHFYETFFGF